MEAVARIVDLVRPVCAELGFELYDVELAHNQLRVAVERSGLGPDLDELAALSHSISAALDAAETSADGDLPSGSLIRLPSGYELEVTSPGLERRLRRPEHFVRAVGQRVAGRTQPGVDGDRRFEGTVLAADADGIALAPGPPAQDKASRSRRAPAETIDELGARRLRYDEIERAHTVFDWRGALGGRTATEVPAPEGDGADDGPDRSPVAVNERATNR